MGMVWTSQKTVFVCFETFGSKALYLLSFNVPLPSSKGLIFSETDTCWGKLTDQRQCVSVCVCVFFFEGTPESWRSSCNLQTSTQVWVTEYERLRNLVAQSFNKLMFFSFWAKKSEEKVDCWLLKGSCLAYVESHILFISMIQTTRFSDPHSSSRHRIVLCLSVGGGSTITESRIKPKLQNLHGPFTIPAFE